MPSVTGNTANGVVAHCFYGATRLHTLENICIMLDMKTAKGMHYVIGKDCQGGRLSDLRTPSTRKHVTLDDYYKLLKQGYLDLSRADRWIADFSSGGIKPRVARAVGFLSKIEYGESSTRVELLSVHEMAEMLGVTPESVSRVMAEFKRNNTLRKIGNRPGETYKIDALKLQYEARQ